jgi:hypothetical protein
MIVGYFSYIYTVPSLFLLARSENLAVANGQAIVNLENEKKTTALAKTERSEGQNEPDAGEKFLEELSKTMNSA